MTLHWETKEQAGKRHLRIITQLGGRIVTQDRVSGVLFNGPKEAPRNSLFIALSDFGYSEGHGIFRKSLAPNRKSEINF